MFTMEEAPERILVDPKYPPAVGLTRLDSEIPAGLLDCFHPQNFRQQSEM